MDAFAGKRQFFWHHLRTLTHLRLLAKAAPIFGRDPLNVLKTRHILLFAKGFMDKSGLDPERISRCCYALATASGVYSFCAYNNLVRRNQQPKGVNLV